MKKEARGVSKGKDWDEKGGWKNQKGGKTRMKKEAGGFRTARKQRADLTSLCLWLAHLFVRNGTGMAHWTGLSSLLCLMLVYSARDRASKT
jgi:hypothetical protein